MKPNPLAKNYGQAFYERKSEVLDCTGLTPRCGKKYIKTRNNQTMCLFCMFYKARKKRKHRF